MTCRFLPGINVGSGFSKVLRIFFLLILFFSIKQNSKAQIQINEVLAFNASVNYDPQYFNFPGWIELYNSSSLDINIGGYYLSDSRTNKTKWAIPAGTIISAKGYLMIYCDSKNTGYHSNFGIDADGEGLYLYARYLTFMDSVQVPKQYSNISYGRLANGSTWSYILTPTPGKMNLSSGITGLLPKPVFSLPSGFYGSSINLVLSSTIAGLQIRYTLDGSEPTLKSALYVNPITLSQTTVVKAKTFSSFAIPSETKTITYFINEHAFNLPVISISMDPKFLWNDTIGIYVAGTNGISGNCTGDPKNYNQDWGRYCFVEFYNNTDTSGFKKDFETKIYGACSRNFFDQKSLAFYARGTYGSGHLDYKLFPDKNIDKFDGFVLRNSGNDFNVTQFRDLFMQKIIKGKLNIDWQAGRGAVVFLNGAYWGNMNLREKLNEQYIEHNARIDKDSIDLIEKDAEVIVGSNSDYVSFINQLSTMKLYEPATFDFINSKIDVEEYIHYNIAEIYFGNYDWPGNNIKFWQPKKLDGKWRWMLFDTDFGFDLFDESKATYSTLNYMTDSITGVGWPNPQWSTNLFRMCLKNPVFRNLFIQTFQASLNSVFKPQRINYFVDSMVSIYKDEMVYHKTKWGGTINDWNYQTSRLKNYAVDRYNFMPIHIKEFFQLNQPLSEVVYSVTPSTSGKAKICGIQTNNSDTIQLYQNIPFKVEAIPNAGYKFKQWYIKKEKQISIDPISKGDSWKYNDLGQNLGTSWYLKTYDDTSWPSGYAQLGYGDGDETTIVKYGNDINNKQPTTYFRKKIVITDTSNLKLATINLLCDDGAVIYINGTEAVRFNMPLGTISYSSLASSASVENVYVTYKINPKLFIPGENIIAVEIHQNSVTSSDLSFDMNMNLSGSALINEYVSQNISFTDTLSTKIIYKAEFEPQQPVSNVYINEIAAINTSIPDNYGNTDDWFELYNANTDTVDISGFLLTDNFSNKNKFQIWNNGTKNMLIPPHGYRLFWADEEQHQGNNHTSFKLSGSGERIGLYQVSGVDTLLIDSISYGAQNVATSFIRFPDGAKDWFFTTSITPNSTNIKSNTVDINTFTDKTGILKIYPNPVKSALHVVFENGLQNANYVIYNNMGQIILYGKLDNSPIDCNMLKPGVYYLVITDRSGRYNKGFIKN